MLENNSYVYINIYNYVSSKEIFKVYHRQKYP